MMQGEGIQASFDVKMKEGGAGADRIPLVLLQGPGGAGFKTEPAITALAGWITGKAFLGASPFAWRMVYPRRRTGLQFFTYKKLAEEQTRSPGWVKEECVPPAPS